MSQERREPLHLNVQDLVGPPRSRGIAPLDRVDDTQYLRRCHFDGDGEWFKLDQHRH